MVFGAEIDNVVFSPAQGCQGVLRGMEIITSNDNPCPSREETEPPRTLELFTEPIGFRASYFLKLKYATLSTFNVPSFSLSSHYLFTACLVLAAFSQGQAFIVLMKQWNPVLMQGTVKIWLSFTAIWVNAPRSSSSAKCGIYPGRSNKDPVGKLLRRRSASPRGLRSLPETVDGTKSLEAVQGNRKSTGFIITLTCPLYDAENEQHRALQSEKS
ncbi:hypothetical protein OG21DRAFT_1607153 [Imleria badia]|nr:hypothetical protein OG21DRAFT_1607153 [Imleria badia]